MRPKGVRPKFGGQGVHRPNSSNQNSPRPQGARPPCSKSPRLSRGNGNANRNARMFGPYGPMVGPNGPMLGPNVPMMGPRMTPSGPTIRPGAPMMGPNGFMMMPNGSMIRPNGPISCPGFMNPTGPNGMRPAFATPPPRGPPMLPNGSFSQNCNGSSPHQPSENVYSGNGVSDNESSQSKTTSNNGNYDYPQFGAAPGMNCGWPINFPPPWNFSSPPNQVYYQNPNQHMDSQFSNQDYSHSYSNDYDQGYSQEYSQDYDQYYNNAQTYMPNDYYNVKQENNQANMNHNGPKNKKKKNEKFQKMRTHYCDTCDRSFPSEEALATHLSEHKVCGLDECKFTAHPRVVEKHQQMQHYSGLYRRIGSLYTPEDIEKWRSNRKKNYPTSQNVQERRAKQEEMFARGERMGSHNNRGQRHNFQRNGRFQQRPNSRPKHQLNEGNTPDVPQPPSNQPAQPPKKWKPVFPPVAEIIEESEERSGVKPFRGTAASLPKTPNSSVDPETPISLADPETPNSSADDDAPKPVQKISVPVSLNTSLSFLSEYGHSSSEDDSETEEPQNDSTVAEEPAPEKSLGEPAIVEMNSSHVERKVDPLQAKNSVESPLQAKISDNALTVAALQPSTTSEDSVCGKEKIENECLSTNTNEAVTQQQLDNETEDGEIQDSPAGNAEEPQSTSFVEPLSPMNISQSCHSKESSPTTRSESKNVPAVTSQNDGVLEEKLSQETEPCISGEKKCGALTSNKTVSLLQSDKEVNYSKNGHDCSDDSGPEEVAIVKDGGDKEGDDNEENDEVICVSGGGRKRRRHTRQASKKGKTDEKQTNQQQDKNVQRPESRVVPRTHHPVRRAPTLLEKLLSKEICHERNVILQCVRYVVENNYFRNERK